MSKFYSYLNTASGIIKSYDGDLPLSVFLKSFFSSHKKYGSKDRKQITNICFCYFRLRNALPPVILNDEIPKQNLLLGLFICKDQPDSMLEALAPEWNNKIQLSVEKKFSCLKEEGIHLDITAVFPGTTLLSDNIDYRQFCKSFLIQPDLFLRIRPGYDSIVKRKLSDAGIDFSVSDEHTVILPNITKVNEWVLIDKEVVIQDYSSQHVSDFLKPLKREYPGHIRIWDCCAASGGKSILANDIFNNAELTVSDIRTSILKNLQLRFDRAGIIRYTSFVADLTQHNIPADTSGYDLVICDVPCSGSGTWSRTPEQLYFWQETDILHYTGLQRRITSNIIPFIKPGGYLLYITCSVFRKENEEIIEDILENFSLRLLQMHAIKGYSMKADTMFAALLQKEA